MTDAYQYTEEGLPYIQGDASGVVDGAGANPLQVLVNPPPPAMPDNQLARRGVLDQLLGLTGDRFQTWPERMLRSGLSLPHDVATGELPTWDPVTGHTSDALIQRVQDLAGVIGSGSLPAAALGDAGRLGMAGGKLVQPAADAAAPVFHSAVEHALLNAPQDKATAPQWLGWLKNQPGVKQDELDWMGLSDPQNLPAGPKGQVTKDDMLAHVQGHGAQIQEVEKGGAHEEFDYSERDMDRAEDRAGEILHEQFVNEHPEMTDPDKIDSAFEAYIQTEEAQDRHSEITHNWLDENAEDTGDGTGTRYADYQLPGGDNYRELLLTMPPSEKAIGSKTGMTPREQFEFAPKTGADLFRSSHWDEPNVLGHLRMNDREIPDVGKSLHLEELQSDWHQQGRKQGYAKKVTELPEGYEVRETNPNSGRYKVYRADGAPFGADAAATQEEAITNALPVIGERNHVPDAPFKSTWPDLLLKRAIAKAAREGYDAVSWTPGEQQAARYDLSKSVTKLEYSPQTKQLRALNGGNVLINKEIEPNELAGVIGKEAADRLLNKPTKTLRGATTVPGSGKNYDPKATTHELSGLDLKVGGEGMKAFYDKMLVDKANAIGKKFGAKVEWKELPGAGVGEEGSVSKELGTAQPRQSLHVPVLRLTPKLKDAAVGRGFPLFAHGLPHMFVPAPKPADDGFDDKLRNGAAL